jgi:hypothetical protein
VIDSIKAKIMKLLKNFTLHAAFLTFSFLPMPAFAGSPQGDYYIQQALDRYFSVPSDAENLSTGGSYSTTCESSACIFMNPAGLAELSKTEFSASVGGGRRKGNEFISGEQIEQSELEGYGTIAIPFGTINDGIPSSGTLSIALSRYEGSSDDSIHTDPDGHRRSLAYGYAPIKNLSLGYSFTFYDDQLHSDLADLHSHARFLHLFGAKTRLSDGLTFGSVFKYGIGQSDTEDFRLSSNGLSHLKEFGGTLGLTKEWQKLTGRLSADYADLSSMGNLSDVSTPVVIGSSERGHVFNLRAGAQVPLFKQISLRLGARWYRVTNYTFERDDLKDLNGTVNGMGWSAGLGYVLKTAYKKISLLKFDYGVEYAHIGSGSWEHLLTISIPFNSDI